MGSEVRVLRELEACRGVLRLLCEYSTPAAYVLGGGVEPEYWLEFEDKAGSVRIEVLADLPAVLAQRGCSLASAIEAQADADTLADMIGRMANLGRVILVPDLYIDLEGRFDVSLTRCLPAIHGTRLSFTTVSTTELTIFAMRRVEVDLQTMQVDLKDIPPK